MPIPKAIAEAPDLLQGLSLFFSAYKALQTCRQVGMGEGPIPWTAISYYADTLEFDDDQRSLLHYFVGKLDGAYFEYKAANAPPAQSKKPKGKR